MTTTTLTTFADSSNSHIPKRGKQELVDGEVIAMPAPEDIHSVVSMNLISELLPALGKRRVRGDHTGYRIGGGWLEPDVSILWPDQGSDGGYMLRSPMIAVEILSPGEEIEPRLTLYFEDGAAEVWVINPRHKTMTVYAREDGKVVRRVVHDEYRSESIPFTLRLADIFES